MKGSFKEVVQYFSKLGCIAFGGPAAHIAMMQKDLVEEKKWLSSEEFLDYMGATNLIPGPNSTEMTMHCGYHRAGVKGLIGAGASFIIPATLITLLIAVFYEQISDINWVVPIIAGIKAAVISIIVGVILKLGKKAVTGVQLAILGILVIVANILGLNEVLCILGAGLLFMIAKSFSQGQTLNSIIILPMFALLKTAVVNSKLFLIFLKIGAVLFGSGYVLFAYLDGELIDNLGWLTHDDLLEAIAIGQITPGPVLSTATFIGYKLAGFQGAILATLGIFIPSFFYVWILNRLVRKMRESKILQYFLQAVNVAAVAVMVVVAIKMTASIVVDWKTTVICILSFAAYFYFDKISTVWIVVGGAAAAFLLSFI